jgi:hypothetical protein
MDIAKQPKTRTQQLKEAKADLAYAKRELGKARRNLPQAVGFWLRQVEQHEAVLYNLQ